MHWESGEPQREEMGLKRSGLMVDWAKVLLAALHCTCPSLWSHGTWIQMTLLCQIHIISENHSWDPCLMKQFRPEATSFVKIFYISFPFSRVC